MENNHTISKPGRGGARKGAGRPAGAATKKTREIADRAAAEGLTPLEVMLRAMREHVAVADKAESEAERLTALNDAAAVAKDAAPYIHPRLAAVEMSGPDGGPVEFSAIERVHRLNWLFAEAAARMNDPSRGLT